MSSRIRRYRSRRIRWCILELIRIPQHVQKRSPVQDTRVRSRSLAASKAKGVEQRHIQSTRKQQRALPSSSLRC
jgi:hypothetical protein